MSLGEARPIRGGGVSAFPKIWDTYLRPYGLTQSDRIRHSNAWEMGHDPYPNRSGLSAPSLLKIVAFCLHPYTVSQTVTKFCMVSKVADMKNFTGSFTPRPWPKLFMTEC